MTFYLCLRGHVVIIMESSFVDTLNSAHAVLHGHDGTMPTQTDRSIEFAQLMTMMTSINQSVQAGFTKMDTRLDALQHSLSVVTADVDHLKSAVQIVEDDVNVIKDKTIPELEKDLTDKIEALEKARLEAELYSKKANLLFFNIPLASAAYMEDTEAVLRDHLATIDFPGSVALQFVNVHRLPTKNDSTRPDPIIAKFVTMKERNAVLNFKPSGDKKLSVAPHLPAAMQAARKRLVPIRNKKIAEGYAARIRVKGTEVHLLVNNAIFKP